MCDSQNHTRVFKHKSFISSLVTKTVHLSNLEITFQSYDEIYRDGPNIDKYPVLPFKPSLDKSVCLGHIQCLAVEFICAGQQ